jgi:hypothetical protein
VQLLGGVDRISQILKKQFMCVLCNRTPGPVTAKVDDVHVMALTRLKQCRNVFIAPSPEFDVLKAGGSNTSNFVFWCKFLV